MDDIEYTMPIYDDYLQIACSYNFTEDIRSIDLMDTYLSFNISYYVSILVSFILFTLTWNMFIKKCEKLRIKRQDSSFWTVLRALLDQDNFPDIQAPSVSMLSLLVTLLFYLLINRFMLNMMSADLVIIKEPRVVTSYDDIIDREDVSVLFLNGWDDEVFFRDAEKGTPEYEVWKKRIILDDVSIDSVSKLWQPVLDQHIVSVSRDWISHAISNMGISKNREMGLLNVRSIETNIDKYFTNSFMINKLAPIKLKEFLNKRSASVARSGILEWFIKDRVPILFGNSELTLRLYNSKKLFLPKPPEPGIKFINIQNFRFLFYILCLFSMICLIFEMYHFDRCLKAKKR